jgi:hypothetical protein
MRWVGMDKDGGGSVDAPAQVMETRNGAVKET